MTSRKALGGYVLAAWALSGCALLTQSAQDGPPSGDPRLVLESASHATEACYAIWEGRSGLEVPVNVTVRNTGDEPLAVPVTIGSDATIHMVDPGRTGSLTGGSGWVHFVGPALQAGATESFGWTMFLETPDAPTFVVEIGNSRELLQTAIDDC